MALHMRGIRACVVMIDGDDIRGDHVRRTSLLGLLIPHAPRLDQIAYMATVIADFGIVAHFYCGFLLITGGGKGD